jgi:glycosyltransferase involved in cell wall biosynthesis
LIIVEAVALLTEHGKDVVFEMVGWPERGDPILTEIESLAKQRGILDRIRYLGSRPLGPELFVHYQQADIFVIASLSSFEGFPRAIWEAMAHSLPVVATRVGSIPAFVDGVAELVSPGSAVEFAEAVAKIIEHSETRQAMIKRGLALARSNTLEAQIEPMVTKMRSWLEK